MVIASNTRDRFAELYVAGILADDGWNVYLPIRDEGFDFLIAKPVGATIVIRPVQVKGKYPEQTKEPKPAYGYVGALKQLHPAMVLAIPYFTADVSRPAPVCIAYMPLGQIRRHSRGHRCQPALFNGAVAVPRREYQRYFDLDGMRAMESLDWT